MHLHLFSWNWYAVEELLYNKIFGYIFFHQNLKQDKYFRQSSLLFSVYVFV